MPRRPAASRPVRRVQLPLCLSLAVMLSACGGGSPDLPSGAAAPAAAAALPGPMAVAPSGAALPLPAGLSALPTYHMAAVIPPPPGDIDVGGTNASARQEPARFALGAEAASIDTTRLSPEALGARLGAAARAVVRLAPGAGLAAPTGSTPAAATVYTPAQIRAAYGLPALPAAGTSLTGATAVALGAGQTIYIVDANDNPNAASDLNTFSTNFGLPTCAKLVLSTATPLPLPAAGSGCELDIAYSNAGGGFNAKAPAYDAGWAPEIALDVQWAHAIAPLARIVLLESASANNTDLAGSVQLANRMGPGVVSMSFGSAEGSWVTASDSVFTTSGMTYLASTGDSGAGVSWPAVSPYVLAVGGTSLSYPGSGKRSETAWSGSGGGISAYESLPGYQSGVSIAGGGTLRSRAVADVSFNADPNTGQYVAVTPPGGSTGWYIYGGTSISSPQWAGVLALANAARAANQQAALGDVHAPIYAQIAAVPGNYAAALDDITSGADGGCATCKAAAGYDQATGWGTPNVASLLSLLSSVQTLPPLPAATMPSGTAGVAYATQWAATDSAHGALSYFVAGAPAGLAVSGAGAVSWASPPAGTYTFTVTVRNSAGRSASGNVTLLIAPAPAAPTVPGGALMAKTGSAVSLPLGITAPANAGTITYLASGAPAGVAVTSAGVLTWSKAVAGIYPIKVTATNAYGKAASGTYTLTVIAQAPPTFTGSTALTGVAGSAFAATIAASDPNAVAPTFSLAGAPAGLSLSAGGALSWAKAVLGNYSLAITARDSYGYSATATYTLQIDGPPHVPGARLTGAAGSPLVAAVGATDPLGATLSYTLGSAPAGMGITTAGVLTWSAPVRGVYLVNVTARNAAGLSTTGGYTVTIYGLPVLAATSLSAAAGSSFTASLKATDPNASAMTFSLSGAPAGLTLSSGGTLYWAKAVKGNYSLVVKVSDAVGMSTTVTLPLTVK